MPEIGKTVLHYRILEMIGVGGMGEVYRAKDQKLGRDVAIKVLPEEFAKDADRVARFQREAKLLASLNHPNIASIYGLEESDGTHFLVLELIEGDTLADRIKSGPIPVEESLKLALQIAEALEAAHEKGVIHRDLKPANIKITPDGKVKVLDFGLAKAFAGDKQGMILSDSPTLSITATEKGVILGTAAYMSPEQASGEAVDKRADIWAFGVVLYEMLTGRSLFAGENVSQTLARVLERQPDFTALPKNLHPKIVEILQHCLVKEAKNRCHDIADVRIDIQRVLVDPSGAFVQVATAVEPGMRLRMMLPWLAAAVVLTAIIAGIAILILWPTLPQPRIARFAVELAGEQQSPLDAVALSPDGSRFVYEANNQLYVHALDQMEPTPIPGTKEGADPYFSPDGETIAFSTPTQLKAVSLAGGAPVVLAEVGGGESGGAGRAQVGVWHSQNGLIFGQSGDYGLSRVPASGGTPELFAELADYSDLDYPEVLPGGEWVLFTGKLAKGSWNNTNIVAQSIITGERKVVLEGGHFARYAPTGHLIYAQNGTLLAVGFDADKVEVTGKAVILVQNMPTLGLSAGRSQFAIADNGTLIYVPGTTDASTARHTLVWVDRQGKEEPFAAEPNYYGSPRISPDGTKVLFIIKNDIWTWDVVRENMMRLTFNESLTPLWTLDGKRIAFWSESVVYWMAADGTDTEEIGSAPGELIIPWAWSIDGKTLVTTDVREGSGFDIGSISMEGDRPHKPLLQKDYWEIQPTISPDGRWLAYTSDQSGQQLEIYVRPFPDIDNGKWVVSTGGGDSPLWSANGKELFYRKNDEVIAVSIETEPTFKAGNPKILFGGNYVRMSPGDGHPWDISPDGKRFLMMKESTGDATIGEAFRPKIIVVLNWFEELKERVPRD